SARTARLIGRENVANAEGALIELVKNCYDADSPGAIVLIDKENDLIQIIDAGDGMTDKIIEEQWMKIGTDDKLNNAVTASGRIKAGAKGIGRFALDRLGERCTMITFPAYNNKGFQWVVDWSDFEVKKDGQNININEVFANLEDIENTTYKKELNRQVKNEEVLKIINSGIFNHGTILSVSGLRDEWKDHTITRIFENLQLLTPPDGTNKINIWIVSSSEPGKYGLIPNEEFLDYDYKVVATYRKNKSRKVKINIHRNEFDFSQIDERLFEFDEMRSYPFDRKTFEREHFELETNFSILLRKSVDKINIAETIGDFEFIFYFLKNSMQKDDREKYKYKEFLGDRAKWLEKFGGIKLYRDNFRVRPYGEVGTPAYDWLMLGERYSQNPAAVSRKGSRIRPHQVAGVFKFSRLSNPGLEDKSSREGLQENESLDYLKNLLVGIIKVQEDDRSTIAYNLKELNNIINEDARSIKESEDIAEENDDYENSHTSEEIKAKTKTVKKGFKAVQRKLVEKEEELSISRAMASAGVMIASFSHEFHSIKNDLTSRTVDLKKYLSLVIDKTKLKNVPDRKNPLKLIDEFQKHDDKIKQWLEFSVELTKKDRRKNRKVDLKDYLGKFALLWEKLFKERGVEFNCSFKRNEDFFLKISELDLDTIFDNLITNSIEAFQMNGFNGEKRISIGVENIKNNVSIIYSDTGPGIPKEFKNPNDIFIPFETSKKDDLGNDIGTGLGMWLVKSSIDSNKGKAELRRPENGFLFIISFTSFNDKI
ncbi:MAG: sensor histidine kinase, partial [Segetibacter sp.]